MGSRWEMKMLEANIEVLEPNECLQYMPVRHGKWIPFADVLQGWEHDAAFRSGFTELLARSPFDAFRWETPALTKVNANQPFRFVLWNEPMFVSRSTDAKAFEDYFSKDQGNCGVISFANLRGDAVLVVPSPRTSHAAYGHFAAFLRRGPKEQVDALWCVVSQTVRSKIGVNPIWLSTAGGGVAWLHVRIDTFPKYYGHVPYTET